MLFSATMPGQIVALACRYMSKPTHIRAADAGDESATVDAIEQHVALPPDGQDGDRVRVLQARRARPDHHLHAHQAPGPTDPGRTHRAWFRCRLRARRPGPRSPRAGSAGLPQQQGGRSGCHGCGGAGYRRRSVTHVINYECPDDEKTYVHRIGRTSRPAESGVARALVDWEDMARWAAIDRALKLPFAEPIETYPRPTTSTPASTSPPKPPAGCLDRRAPGRGEAEELEDLGETSKARRRWDKPGAGTHATGATTRDVTTSGVMTNAATASPHPAPRNRRRTRSDESGPATATGQGTAAPATDGAGSSADPTAPANVPGGGVVPGRLRADPQTD